MHDEDFPRMGEEDLPFMAYSPYDGMSSPGLWSGAGFSPILASPTPTPASPAPDAAPSADDEAQPAAIPSFFGPPRGVLERVRAPDEALRGLCGDDDDDDDDRVAMDADPEFRLSEYDEMFPVQEEAPFRAPWLVEGSEMYLRNLDARHDLRAMLTILPVTCKYVVPPYTPLTDNTTPRTEDLMAWLLDGMDVSRGDYRVTSVTSAREAMGADAQVLDVTVVLFSKNRIYELPRYVVMWRALEWILEPRHRQPEAEPGEPPRLLQPLINNMVLLACHPMAQRALGRETPEWIMRYAADPRTHLSRFVDPCDEIKNRADLSTLRPVVTERISQMAIVLFGCMVLLRSMGLLMTEQYMLPCMRDLAQRGTGPGRHQPNYVPADGAGTRWVPAGEAGDGEAMDDEGQQLAADFWPFLLGRVENPTLEMYLRMAVIQTESMQELAVGNSRAGKKKPHYTVVRMAPVNLSEATRLTLAYWGEDTFEVTDLDRFGKDYAALREEVTTAEEARARKLRFRQTPDGGIELLFEVPRMMPCQMNEVHAEVRRLFRSNIRPGIFQMYMDKPSVDEHVLHLQGALTPRLSGQLFDESGMMVLVGTYTIDPRHTFLVGPHYAFSLMRALSLHAALRSLRSHTGGVTGHTLASVGEVLGHAIPKALEDILSFEDLGTPQEVSLCTEITALAACLPILGRVPSIGSRLIRIDIFNYRALALTLRRLSTLLAGGDGGRRPCDDAPAALGAVLQEAGQAPGPLTMRLLTWIDMLIYDHPPLYLHSDAVVALACLVPHDPETGEELISDELGAAVRRAVTDITAGREAVVALDKQEHVREAFVIWAKGETPPGADATTWEMRRDFVMNISRAQNGALPAASAPYTRHMHRKAFVRALGTRVENWAPKEVTGTEPDALLRARLSGCYCTPQTVMRAFCLHVEDSGCKTTASPRDSQGRFVTVGLQKDGVAAVGPMDMDEGSAECYDEPKDPPLALNFNAYTWETSLMTRVPKKDLIGTSSTCFPYTYGIAGPAIRRHLIPIIVQARTETTSRRGTLPPAAPRADVPTTALAALGTRIVRKRKRRNGTTSDRALEAVEPDARLRAVLESGERDLTPQERAVLAAAAARRQREELLDRPMDDVNSLRQLPGMEF